MSESGPLSKSFTRRDALRATAASAACLAMPTVVPARALGRDGATAPSERIVMGGLGVNPRGRGGHDLKWILGNKDVQFVAICDVQKSARDGVKKVVDEHNGNADCKTYTEMREFLATTPDIDAVLIATGDRWHSLAAILAMRAGKDVYSEKPSAMTIAEGRAVLDTARRYGRIYQTGTQRLSEPNFVYCIEAAKLGKLGKVHTVYAHIAPWDAAEMSHAWLPEEKQPAKDVVDWEAWLGPCPWRPYNSTYVQGGWRGHYDFHTSCIGEWGAHTFAQGQAGIDALNTSPVKYEYVKNTSGDGMVTTFASGVKMVLSRGDKHWHGSCGMRFDGDEGWIACADGYEKPEASSPSLLEGMSKVLDEYTQKTGRSLDHVRNFLDCVKSRRLTVANAGVMHHSMSTVHAANICMWLKRDMQYDPKKEEFADAEANRLRTRGQREPYII